jgi:hypothetical protein
MKKIILIALVFTVAAVLGGPLAHAAPVEKTKPGDLTAEIGKDEKPSRSIERLLGT